MSPTRLALASSRVWRGRGNATGFTIFEYGMAGKWLELLKEIAPGVKRVAVIRDPDISAGTGQLGAIQSVAPSFGVELSPVGVHDAAEIEHTLDSFAQGSNGGLLVTGSTLALVHRDARGPVQAARGLLPTSFRRRRRPDLLCA